MTKYCNVEPILHLLSDKDLLESVNVGAVLQALQHGLYNGEVAPVAHAHWKWMPNYDVICTKCQYVLPSGSPVSDFRFCPYCGSKMDEKEGNL